MKFLACSSMMPVVSPLLLVGQAELLHPGRFLSVPQTPTAFLSRSHFKFSQQAFLFLWPQTFSYVLKTQVFRTAGREVEPSDY